MNEYSNRNICPCCNTEIRDYDVIYVDGGDISTGGILTALHEACADRIMEQEKENGIRI